MYWRRKNRKLCENLWKFKSNYNLGASSRTNLLNDILWLKHESFMSACEQKKESGSVVQWWFMHNLEATKHSATCCFRKWRKRPATQWSSRTELVRNIYTCVGVWYFAYECVDWLNQSSLFFFILYHNWVGYWVVCCLLFIKPLTLWGHVYMRCIIVQTWSFYSAVSQ